MGRINTSPIEYGLCKTRRPLRLSTARVIAAGQEGHLLKNDWFKYRFDLTEIDYDSQHNP